MLILGPVKYAVGLTKHELDEHLDVLQAHMEAAPTACIAEGKVLNAGYMLKHAESLVGKELRIWAQTAAGFLAPLVASGQCPSGVWRLWYWLGKLTQLLLIDGVSQTRRDAYMVCTSHCSVLSLLIDAL
jgi:hypothetical protein